MSGPSIQNSFVAGSTKYSDSFSHGCLDLRTKPLLMFMQKSKLHSKLFGVCQEVACKQWLLQSWGKTSLSFSGMNCGRDSETSNSSSDQHKIPGPFCQKIQLNGPLGRFSLQVVMSVCCLMSVCLSAPGKPGSRWTGDFCLKCH